MIRRRMSVVRAPSTNNKAMIRIVNSLLPRSGFSIGTAIEVSYQPGIITIKKLKKHHEHYNVQKKNTVTIPS
jgi:hypothetical protein